MIKEKFLKFLYWFQDHFQFLLQVIVRLTVGIGKKQANQEVASTSKTDVEKEVHHEPKV